MAIFHMRIRNAASKRSEETTKNNNNQVEPPIPFCIFVSTPLFGALSLCLHFSHELLSICHA